MKFKFFMGLGAVALTFSAPNVAEAQLGGFLRDALPSISLPNPFGRDQPISTSIEDAVFADPSRDDFDPGQPLSMLQLPRSDEGGFVLEAGYYSMIAQTYCLRAGTYGPTGGDGYLYAPMKGSARRIVISILQNSNDHADIEQRDIQVLLWAVLARARFENLNSRLKVVAARLLTQRQLASMNRNAIDILSSNEVSRIVGDMPAPIARVARAEADMRRMLSGGSNYNDLEAVAVLAGMAPIGEGSIDVPANRWSLHPDGYWVRYDPSGYSRTTVEIFVSPDSDGVGEVYDPAKSVAVPGNTAKQRIGQSGRSQAN